MIKIGMFTDLHAEMVHDAKKRLETFLNTCDQEDVDFIIQLGDFVSPPVGLEYHCRPEKVTLSMKNVMERPVKNGKELVEMLQRFPKPVYHVLGNHDLDFFSKSEIHQFWNENDDRDTAAKDYYSFDYKGIHFIVLDLNYCSVDENSISFDYGVYNNWAYQKNEPFPYVPKEELEWLEQDLEQASYPSIVFSHEGINHGFLNALNSDEILDILKKAPRGIRLCINGHKHVDYFTTELGIPFISLNSMSGYVMGPNFAALRFSKEIDEQYKNLRLIAPYEDPLYAILTITDEYALFSGRDSKFIEPSPQQLGGVFSHKSMIPGSSVKTRKIIFEQGEI